MLYVVFIFQRRLFLISNSNSNSRNEVVRNIDRHCPPGIFYPLRRKVMTLFFFVKSTSIIPILVSYIYNLYLRKTFVFIFSKHCIDFCWRVNDLTSFPIVDVILVPFTRNIQFSIKQIQSIAKPKLKNRSQRSDGR